MAPSLTTFQLILVYASDVFLLNTCMDHVLERMSEESGCGVLFGTVWIIDLDVADDAVIFAKTTEVLAGALNSLSEEHSLLDCEIPG